MALASIGENPQSRSPSPLPPESSPPHFRPEIPRNHNHVLRRQSCIPSIAAGGFRAAIAHRRLCSAPPPVLLRLRASARFAVHWIQERRPSCRTWLPRNPIGAPGSTAVESLPYHYRLASLLSISASRYSHSYTELLPPPLAGEDHTFRLQRSTSTILREDPRVVPNNTFQELKNKGLESPPTVPTPTSNRSTIGEYRCSPSIGVRIKLIPHMHYSYLVGILWTNLVSIFVEPLTPKHFITSLP
jgi:hypothetical protein